MCLCDSESKGTDYKSFFLFCLRISIFSFLFFFVFLSFLTFSITLFLFDSLLNLDCDKTSGQKATSVLESGLFLRNNVGGT